MSIWHSKVRDAFIGVATKEMDRNDFIKEYRSLADEIVYCRKRLKNPVHKKSGKPLTKSTIGGFKDKIEYLKKQLNRYRVVLKLLFLCGYLDPKPDQELPVEQEVIRAFLRDYAKDYERINFWISKTKLTDKDADYWKTMHDGYKQLYESTKKRANILQEALRSIAWGDDTEDEESNEENLPCKIYPFKAIDGGQKFEDQPPFTN